ncbi:energy transduction protein TonB [Campylobacter showae]|uniref:TonB family domain protein n=1 Tax=Campylobacter showae RM3277 TaxID=553219 RepID=C6RI87_9BACT|nr:protein TonB [Campylobacter showae]EET78888.1 TonB family domain protein [Campylobacter showae RM3277]QCD49334.1 energy transduction protein TonB [Campylobacter showae]
MRYFLVSLVLNLALLFLPLNSRPIESAKPQETIKIKLNLTQEEPSKETREQIPPQSAEPFERPQETQPEPVKFEPEPEILQPEPKPVEPEPKKPKEEKKQPPKPKIKKQISPKPAQAVKEEPKFEPAPAPTQILPAEQSAQPSSNLAPAKQPAAQDSGEAKEQNACKEGVGFTVAREPEAKYPKKALMLRLSGMFRVEVDFKFDGEIKIIAVRGKNKIFNDEAVKITKELEIKALKNISNCIITKPYEFKTEE